MKSVRNHIAYLLIGVIAGIIFTGAFPDQSYMYLKKGYEISHSRWEELDSSVVEKKFKPTYPFVIAGCCWLILALTDPFRGRNKLAEVEAHRDLY